MLEGLDGDDHLYGDGVVYRKALEGDWNFTTTMDDAGFLGEIKTDGAGWAHSYHANGHVDQWKNIETIEISDLRTIVTGSETGSLTFTDGGYDRWDAANDNSSTQFKEVA